MRHKLSMPFARYVKQGSFFLEDHKVGLVVLFRWEQHHRHYGHPGSFAVRYAEPIHNGGRRPFRYFDTKEYYWDEYEDFLIKWKDSTKYKFVLGRQRVVLKAWQIFLYCFDGPVARNLATDLLYDSVNLELSLRERHKSMQLVLQRLEEHHKELHRAWQEYASNLLSNYLYWLRDFNG